MSPTPSIRAAFSRRLKERRLSAKLSQRGLGVSVGLPEDVAGVRINRYERNVHACDPETAQRIAETLGVSVAYLYAETDELAEMIEQFRQMPITEQQNLLAQLRGRNKSGK